LGQAVVKKFFIATFLERKIMSTKTSFKRIALVAASALAIAGFSAVPANAITQTSVTWANGTLTALTATAGSAVAIPVTLASTPGGTRTGGSTFTMKMHVASKPTNSAIVPTTGANVVTCEVASSALTSTVFDVARVTGTLNSTTASDGIVATDKAVSTNQAAAQAGTCSFTPDVAGLYTLTQTITSTMATDTVTTYAETNATVTVIVSGAAIVQAQTGLGAASGTQISGNSAAAAFWIPGGGLTTDNYTVTATGATISSVLGNADNTDVVNASTAVATAGIVKTNGTDFVAGASYTGQVATTAVTVTGNHSDGLTVKFTSATASTAIVTFKKVSATTGVATTLSTATVVFGATAVVSSTLSTAFIGQGNACAVAANTVPITVTKTASVALAAGVTTGATICVNAKDTAGAALIGQAVSVTIAGPGLVTLASGNGSGSS
jgi:hypothetical protein